MGYRDDLAAKALHLGTGAGRRVAASTTWQQAGEGFRGLREMYEDDDRSLDAGAFLQLLVRAVRADDDGEAVSSRSVQRTARKRRRRLGMASFVTGPLVGTATEAIDLYCDTATACDVANLHGLDLGHDEIAAQMLVLWSVTGDLPSAQSSIAGDPPVTELLGQRISAALGERMPEKLTKRSLAKAFWDVRDMVPGADHGAAVREAMKGVAFTGHRTKKLIARIEEQLGVA